MSTAQVSEDNVLLSKIIEPKSDDREASAFGTFPGLDSLAYSKFPSNVTAQSLKLAARLNASKSTPQEHSDLLKERATLLHKKNVPIVKRI